MKITKLVNERLSITFCGVGAIPDADRLARRVSRIGVTVTLSFSSSKVK